MFHVTPKPTSDWTLRVSEPTSERVLLNHHHEMITDDQLYILAITLGLLTIGLIFLFHLFNVNVTTVSNWEGGRETCMSMMGLKDVYGSVFGGDGNTTRLCDDSSGSASATIKLCISSQLVTTSHVSSMLTSSTLPPKWRVSSTKRHSRRVYLAIRVYRGTNISHLVPPKGPSFTHLKLNTNSARESMELI